MATLLTETDVRAKDGLTRLSPEQLHELKERGFVTVRAIAPAADVAVMDTVIRDLLARGVGFKEGARRDLVDPEDSPGANSLTELVRPQNYAAVLRRSAYFESAYAIARQVLGQDAEFAFDHAILKPAFHGAETPWHQDEAYQAERDSERDQIAFWMPTAVATVENGCMRYVPGSHKVGVLPHQPLGGDARVHALQCIGDFDADSAVYCPLQPGDAVIHAGRTLHSAGPNMTANPRLAYILVFAGPSRRAAAPRDHSWLKRPNETAARRRKLWLWRGGAVIELARRVARNRYYHPAFYIGRLRRLLVRQSRT